MIAGNPARVIRELASKECEPAVRFMIFPHEKDRRNVAGPFVVLISVPARRAKRLYGRFFPGHAQILPAHMAIGGQLAIDGPAQVQLIDDSGGAEVEHLLHRRGELVVRHHAGAGGIHHHGYGSGHADGVGQLDLTALGQPGGHHVFRRVTGHIGGGTVYLGGVPCRKKRRRRGGRSRRRCPQ